MILAILQETEVGVMKNSNDTGNQVEKGVGSAEITLVFLEEDMGRVPTTSTVADQLHNFNYSKSGIFCLASACTSHKQATCIHAAKQWYTEAKANNLMSILKQKCANGKWNFDLLYSVSLEMNLEYTVVWRLSHCICYWLLCKI